MSGVQHDAPLIYAPSRSPSTAGQISLQVEILDKKSGEIDTHVIHLPRSTGLRTTFQEVKAVVAVKCKVEEDRITDAKVDGMIVSMK